MSVKRASPGRLSSSSSSSGLATVLGSAGFIVRRLTLTAALGQGIFSRFGLGENTSGRDITGGKLTSKLLEGAQVNMASDIRHQLKIHMRVVHAQHAQAEDFLHIQKMAEISA